MKKLPLYLLAVVLWASSFALMFAWLSGNALLEKITAGISIFCVTALPAAASLVKRKRV